MRSYFNLKGLNNTEIFQASWQRAGIIPENFENVMASMIGFRNLLVHNYASINLDLVYEFLQTKISDFAAFSKYIAEWLSRH
jgi:uncharacterized protein YutE (UPF0331/DUF86 family)